MSNILVIHQGAIGDFLLTLAVIQSIRRLEQAGKVTVIASAPSARIGVGRSAVDACLSPDDVGLYRLFMPAAEPSDRLLRLLEQHELIINFTGGPDEILHRNLSDIHDGRLISVDPRPSSETRDRRRHITEQWTESIRRSGLPIDDPEPPRIDLPALPRGVLPRLLIHPGSGGQAKCWPIEQFIALVDRLQGVEVNWMTGPAEYQITRRLADRDEGLLWEEDLGKAAEMMKFADLYLGNDSGMTHLAAAIGLPVIAIFGATDPAIWRPPGSQVTIIQPPDPEKSIADVTVEQVQAEISRHLTT